MVSFNYIILKTRIDNSTLQNHRHLFFFLLPIIVGIVLQFVSLPIITRYISPNDFGIIALSQLFASLIFSICNLGLPVVYQRNYFVAEKKNISTQLLYTIQFFVSLLILFVALIIWIFRNQISELILDNPNFGNFIFLTFLVTCIAGLKDYFLTYYKNSYNSKMFAMISTEENVLSVLLSISFLLFFKLGIFAIVYAQLLSGFIMFSFLVIKFLRRERLVLNLDIFIESLKVSIPLMPKIPLSIIERSSDKMILGYINSVKGVGLLGFANKFSNLNFVFLTALENIFLPRVYKLMFENINEEEAGKEIGRMLMPYIYFSVLFSAVISFFSFEFIYIFSNPKYFEAANYVSISILLTSTYFFGKIPQLVFKKKTKIISYLGILTFCLNFIFGLPMAIYFGAFGVVFSSLFVGLLSVILQMYYSQINYRIYYNWHAVVFIYGILYLGSLILVFFSNSAYLFLILIKITLIIILLIYGFKMNYLKFVQTFYKYTIQKIKEK